MSAIIHFPTKKTDNVMDVLMSNGVWLVADKRAKHDMMVVFVSDGRIVPLERENRELDPARFRSAARFLGPFVPEDVL